MTDSLNKVRKTTSRLKLEEEERLKPRRDTWSITGNGGRGLLSYRGGLCVDTLTKIRGDQGRRVGQVNESKLEGIYAHTQGGDVYSTKILQRVICESFSIFYECRVT